MMQSLHQQQRGENQGRDHCQSCQGAQRRTGILPVFLVPRLGGHNEAANEIRPMISSTGTACSARETTTVIICG